MTLVEFLLARIAEDEDIAKRAAFGWGAAWHDETDEEWSAVHADGQRDMVGCEDGDVTRHIARHDPSRVLAECEAKLRIVEREQGSRAPRLATETHEVEYRHEGEVVVFKVDGERESMTSKEYMERYTVPSPPSEVLKLLALPYADHPDYRDEWKPQISG